MGPSGDDSLRSRGNGEESCTLISTVKHYSRRDNLDTSGKTVKNENEGWWTQTEWNDGTKREGGVAKTEQ